MRAVREDEQPEEEDGDPRRINPKPPFPQLRRSSDISLSLYLSRLGTLPAVGPPRVGAAAPRRSPWTAATAAGRGAWSSTRPAVSASVAPAASSSAPTTSSPRPSPPMVAPRGPSSIQSGNRAPGNGISTSATPRSEESPP